MMSRKSSGRQLFGRLIQDEYIRKAWAEGIIIIILIFALPVRVALKLGQYSQLGTTMSDGVLFEFMSTNISLLFIVFLLGIFIAVLEFGYLFQRNKVDFYHSLPISRGMQFFYRYLTGFVLFALPYALLYGISILVGIAHGAMILGYVKELTVIAVVYLAFFWVFYSVSILAIQLSGSYLSCLVMLAFLHFAGPVFCFLMESCQDIFFRTYVDTGKTILYGSGSAITICLQILERLSYTGYYDTFSMWVLIGMIFILPLAGYVLFLKRPAEKTGCGLAYPVLEPVVRFLVVVGAGVFSGIFLRDLSYSNSDFWLFFGLLAGCVIMHSIMEMILQMNFRAFYQGKISILVCTGFTLICMCIFRFDLLGYDSYLPSAEQLDSAGIYLHEMEYYRNYIREYTEEEFEKMMEQQSVFGYTYTEEEECDELSQMNLKNVQPVLDLAAASIEDGSWSNFGTVTVCYNLKNGRHVYRVYQVNLQENFEDFSEIFAMDRYKESLYPILTRSEENCTVWINNICSEDKTKLTFTDAQYINLLRTYKRELKDLTLETMTTEEPLMLIEFTQSQEDCYNSYPVYPSFEHTLTLLKGYGYDATALEDSIYKIRVIYDAEEAMDAESYLTGENGETSEYDISSLYTSEDSVLWSTDQEQLDLLKPYLVASTYLATNLTLKSIEPGYYVTGYMVDEATGEEMVMEFRIEEGKVSDFVKKIKETMENQTVGMKEGL